MSGLVENFAESIRPEGVEPVVAWAEMTEAEKRYHLAWSHGFLPERYGGYPSTCDEFPEGDDAWVLDSTGDTASLNALHEDDHAMNEGGGGTRYHQHPGAWVGQ